MDHRQVSTNAPETLLGNACPFDQLGDTLLVQESFIDLHGTGI